MFINFCIKKTKRIFIFIFCLFYVVTSLPSFRLMAMENNTNELTYRQRQDLIAANFNNSNQMLEEKYHGTGQQQPQSQKKKSRFKALCAEIKNKLVASKIILTKKFWNNAKDKIVQCAHQLPQLATNVKSLITEGKNKAQKTIRILITPTIERYIKCSLLVTTLITLYYLSFSWGEPYSSNKNKDYETRSSLAFLSSLLYHHDYTDHLFAVSLSLIPQLLILYLFESGLLEIYWKCPICNTSLDQKNPNEIVKIESCQNNTIGKEQLACIDCLDEYVQNNNNNVNFQCPSCSNNSCQIDLSTLSKLSFKKYGHDQVFYVLLLATDIGKFKCSLCYNPITPKDVVILHDHSYIDPICKSCVDVLINNIYRTRNAPPGILNQTCTSNNCKKTLSMQDYQRLLTNNFPEGFAQDFMNEYNEIFSKQAQKMFDPQNKQKLIEAGLISQCTCKAIFSKDNHCNHITCNVCKKEQCYVCGLTCWQGDNGNYYTCKYFPNDNRNHTKKPDQNPLPMPNN
jgi:hypothetical protein